MKSKKILSAIVSFVLLFSTLTFPSHADFEDSLYETAIHNIAAKCGESDITKDINFKWLLADMMVYKSLYPESASVLSGEQIKKYTKALLEYAKEDDEANELAKSIISFRALGYDAQKIYISDTEKLTVVEKLSALIDAKAESVKNIYWLPYIAIAMREYATEEQSAYLLKAMVKQKAKWQNATMGIDAATPMILALSPYYDENEEVKAVIDETVEIVKAEESENGLIGTASETAAPSTGLAIAGLSSLPLENEDIEKLITALMGEATPELDGFLPTTNSFGSEQGFRGLLAYKLRGMGKSIYDFSDYPKNELHALKDESGESVQSSGSTNQSNYQVAEEKISVNVRIMAHNAGECNNSYTYKSNAAKYYPIVAKTVEMEKNQTVFDATVKVLSENGISYTEKGGYIAKIGDFSEFDHGEFSGWMFMVNEKHQTEGSNYIKLIPNSTILWYYTDDYRYEKGSETFGYPAKVQDKKEEITKKTEEEPENNKTNEKIAGTVLKTAEFLQNAVQNPQISVIGGEWAIIGLLASGAEAPSEYFDKYYENVEKTVEENEGVLSSQKYTEYSRVVIALTLMGKNPENVAGYDLTAPICNFEKTTRQGLNGAIWALLALDCGNYGETEVRTRYINYILEREIEEGGWALSKDEKSPDCDVTAMALTALSNHTEEEKVADAVQRGVESLSAMQAEDGGFLTYGEATSESVAQVVLALSALGIDENDERFIKNGKTPTDSLLSYYSEDGGFSHTKGGETNLMATEQALYALGAKKRALEGKTKLLNKNKFRDISGNENEEAILLMAKKGIINGMENNVFAPKENVTRAQFATMLVKALELESSGEMNFADVKPEDWFYPYVTGAYKNGIIFGISDSEFNPNGNISCEEAAAMLKRAAALTEIEDNNGIKNNVDASYGDISDWARDSLIFCIDLDIIGGENMTAKSILTRAEIAQMICNLLKKAELV